MIKRMKKSYLIFLITLPIIILSAWLTLSHTSPLSEKLFQAVRANDINTVKSLVTQGADLDTRDSAGQTPLHSALYHGYTDIAAFLIEKGSDLEIKDNRGGTPLHWAAINSSADNTLLLLKHEANPNVTDKFEMTPLNWAVAKGNAANVKALLENGADKTLKNSRGKTALDYAKERKYTDIMKLLE
ncbi:MAG: uncharacterized protein K0R98_537 [Rickettsiaceae bacterium]|jgi:ankyrin repeat protein|nr:uncharacterized protein [Rickettsiaceae bacterium]